MNKIRQYRPAYFEGFDNVEVEFETTEELLDIPFVKSFKAQRYSLADQCLMAEFRDGKEWWVIGMIDKPNEVALPKWNKGTYETEEGDKHGTGVSWSCGDQVGLKDGRIVKRIRE